MIGSVNKKGRIEVFLRVKMTGIIMIVNRGLRKGVQEENTEISQYVFKVFKIPRKWCFS